MNSNPLAEFSNRDFYSSAVLLAAGCPLQTVKKSPNGYSLFVFNNSPDACHQLLDKHIARQLTVKSWDLIDAIKVLKSRLYQ